MVRWLASWMAIWLAAGFVGSLMDGQFLGTQDFDTGNGIIQVTILSNPFSQVSLNPISWFGAPIAYLGAWVDVFGLNSSLFQPGIMMMLRWVILLIALAPLVWNAVTSIFGRSSSA